MSQTEGGAAFEPRRASDVKAWDHEADVVVMGLGCAGACAAIGAAESGADVLAVERASGGGGTSANSGGQIYIGGGTRIQRACGFEDSPEEMFKYLMASCGPSPDPALVSVFSERSVEHFEWLAGQGVPFKESYFPGGYEPPLDDCLTFSGSEDVYPYAEIARPAPRGHSPRAIGSKGPILMRMLLAAVERARVRTLFDARGQRLIAESDGRIRGVVVRAGGSERCVRARRGVVLTAGGFSYNDEMLERYAPRLLKCSFRLGTEADDGSGILMGAAGGGALLRMEAGDISLPLYPPLELRRGVLVNQYGQRFINEDAYMGVLGEHSILHQEGRVFMLLDERNFRRPEVFECEVAAVGESVAEIEAELGIPSPGLQNTLSLYNTYAERGEDPLFHKRADYLTPLTRPPYGALDLRAESVGYALVTLGGLHIDPDGAVLGASGERVAGLFAAGRTTSGISKQGYSSGISLGDASFFGRRAGRAAAAGPDRAGGVDRPKAG
ncbi:MAG: FAD-dependent oxidoreductase [Proteobacteria bacterium]|nr:FAD-dependent oxidoreductase [Pseudomonadota bacterium]